MIPADLLSHSYSGLIRDQSIMSSIENKIQTYATFNTDLYTLSFWTSQKVYSNEEHIFFKWYFLFFLTHWPWYTLKKIKTHLCNINYIFFYFVILLMRSVQKVKKLIKQSTICTRYISLNIIPSESSFLH